MKNYARVTLVLLQLGCVTTRPMQQPSPSGAQLQRGNAGCPDRPTLVFEQGTFDGRWVRGRMLIEAGSKEVSIHPYALPTSTFSIRDANECGSTRRIAFSNPTLTGVCQKPEDCTPLRLRPGHMFGKQVEFLSAFDKPEQCVDFTVVLSLPGQNDTYGPPELRLRAQRGGPVEMIGADSCTPPTVPGTEK
jgi:hypothetical protein